MTREEAKLRHNVMRLMKIESFANVRGRVKDGILDVYFARSLGADPDFERRILAVDQLFFEQMKAKKAFYLRVNSLPLLQDAREIAFYTDCYEMWKAAGGQMKERSEEEGSLCRRRLFALACGKVIEIFRKITPKVSESMEKSFLVKLFFWFDRLIPEEIEEEGLYSRKIVFRDLVKKQEYLFAYLLTLVGIDVLLLQTKEDISEELDVLGLSQKFKTGEFREVSLGEATPRSLFPEKIGRQDPPQRISERREEKGREEIREREISSGVALPGQYRQGRAEDSGKTSVSETGEKRPLLIRVSDIKRPERDRGSSQTSLSREGEGAAGALAKAAVSSRRQKRELDYEELAKLASSIVMIARCSPQGEVLGSGSGVMIGAEGYILTNCHVMMREAAYFEVTVEDDERKYPVEELIKYNHATDLAVLRIGRKLSPLPLYGGERPLVRGQKVVAIGSPLGLFNSVSDGIISGFRKLDDVEMIQFTAPISAGSSGGALLNLFGELIGVSSGGFMDGQNINLAVGYQYISQFIRGFV
ncbi:MAG: S1C family serine protease [Peptostreptococcaceae bacterium]|nr:S1C family serine protease [Peptostreptococcaceae bacterium]